MDSREAMSDDRVSVEDVSAYYAAMTDRYLNYSGDSLGWHFGLWDKTTTNVQQALLRSNQVLVEGCALAPGRLVVDAGAGLGGLAINLARKYGVRVIGVTVCEPHVRLATRIAQERGVDALVTYRHGDFMDLPFDAGSVDFVLNQESFCYASDREAYLRGVWRVLKPGGRWQAVDGFRGEHGLSDEQEQYHRDAQRGWKIPPLAAVREVSEILEQIGYRDVAVRNLSDMARPTARALVEQGLIHLFRQKMAPESAKADPTFDEHMAACAGFSQGLLEGAFTYHLLGGSKNG
ncbi:MAG: class I SAM-dependent methyltransferase [Spirochaetales bacterium]|nr:class I SAM-dependent methyltransferase [Spirochaetales bacterium]